MPLTATPLNAAPKVVVSIKPLHGLVAGVMAGVASPELIFDSQSSPHSASLKPSQLRALRRAALIFWIGDGLEPSFARAIKAVAKSGNATAVASLAGLKRWPRRGAADWRDREQGRNNAAAPDDGEDDPHIWLDTANAAIIVRAVAERLAAADGVNAVRYRDNEKRLLRRLRELTQALEESFAAARSQRYFVQHDAFQYLEKQFALHPLGVIAISEDRLPGPRHLSELRRLMKTTGAICVFANSPANSALARTLAGATGRVVQLDIMGMEVRRGALAYFRIMMNLATAMTACLNAAPS